MMMKLLVNGDTDSAKLAESVQRMFSEQLTGALGTTGEGGPNVCTIYYAHNKGFIWFTSQEATRHVSALRHDPTVALCIWQRPEVWGSALFGLQLTCVATEVVDESDARLGLDALHARFPGTRTSLPELSSVVGRSRKTALVRLELKEGVLIDESNLGARTFVSFRWDR
jgi:uncharacterized protein YhbP (UPF0306 family)